MVYIYDVMKLVRYIIINKQVFKKHKEYATTRYQNYLHKMRSQNYKVKMLYFSL